MNKANFLILTLLIACSSYLPNVFAQNKVPKSVVVFDLGALDTLDYLDVSVSAVPKLHMHGYLTKFKGEQYTNVGSMFEPDYEVVASLEPDLIVVGGRSQNKLKTMSRLAPTIDTTIDSSNFLAQFYETTTKTANIFNKETEAVRALAHIKNQVINIKKNAPKAGKVLFIMTTGGKITVFGPGSRFGWIYQELGLTPATDEESKSNHGEPVSFEYLYQVNPDILLVLDRDIAIGKDNGFALQLLDNDVVKRLKAYQNNKIIMLNGFAWYTVGTGIKAMQTNLMQIESAIQSD